ncbi:unnamed protein product [Cuscuta epithymum]|uniref:Uncharacterized protein n=1 Tax=Cuscuta epithymum TaxID=186058 RepID=A0AAV0CUV4_9ASTE|nr:unnamed protein product [Cuscuta epithymum]CAH9084185.1 unnamed protein product [Cuscuta epithymum]CAH9146306.1 unnamed protein product [Cuscuta epithymum]
MLVRNLSSPVLKSVWAKDPSSSSSSPDPPLLFLKTRASPLPISARRRNPIKRTAASDLHPIKRDPPTPKIKSFHNGHSQSGPENQESGSDLTLGIMRRVIGGGCAGDGGGENGFDITDEYYQKLIQDHPHHPLILGNYAKFLSQVRGDYAKAEEYCLRAILGSGIDEGSILSMYGDLMWGLHKDADQAISYYDRAVQASPDDCHVLASYARFLWDSGEAFEKEEEQQIVNSGNNISYSPICGGLN